MWRSRRLGTWNSLSQVGHRRPGGREGGGDTPGESAWGTQLVTHCGLEIRVFCLPFSFFTKWGFMNYEVMMTRNKEKNKLNPKYTDNFIST